MNALYQVTKDSINFPVHDNEELARIECGFSSYSFGRLPGCVMAVDGWVVKTRQPYRSEVQNVTCFRNRKDCYGLVVLAGVDSNCKFLFFSVCSPGSTNDNIAWEFSTVYREVIAKNKLPRNYYFIGDEGFVNTKNFLTPYPGQHLSLYEDSFNFHLSRMRQSIEIAFGVMKNRWGIFWRPLQISYDRWKLVLLVTAALHNICINIGEQDIERNDEVVQSEGEDEGEGDDYDVQINEENELGGEELNSNQPYCSIMSNNSRRKKLTEHLQSNGYTRPVV